MPKAPDSVPRGLGVGGRALWSSVADDYELQEHEATLLLQAARVVDLLDRLDLEVRRDGPLVDSPQGMKPHPAAVEARQQSITLARLLNALRLPNGEEGDQQAGARPQRRPGVRGVSHIRGVS